MKQTIKLTTTVCGDGFSLEVDSVYLTNNANKEQELVAIGKINWNGGNPNSTNYRMLQKSIEIENKSTDVLPVEAFIVDSPADLKKLQNKYLNSECLYRSLQIYNNKPSSALFATISKGKDELTEKEKLNKAPIRKSPTPW